MKNKRILTLIAVTAMLANACALIAPAEPTQTPEPAPTQTSTPDPCGPDNVMLEVEKVQALVNSFQDTAYIANNTDVNLLIHPILRLQEMQKELRELEVPDCLVPLKNRSIEYTVSVVNYLLLFMNLQDPAAVELTTAIQNSEALWQTVLGEFNNVLTAAGLEPQQVSELNQPPSESEDSGVTVLNEGPGAVNIRELPDLDSEVLEKLEAEDTAAALGRTEDSEWIQIRIDDVTGWVFAETITIDSPVEDLPVIE